MKAKKICCLYISTYHLFTIILPYINGKIKEGKNVELLLQEDLSEELKRYVKNIRGLNINVEEIVKLEWKSKTELLGKEENKCYVVIGDENFIINYEKIMAENEMENEILSCYKMNKKLEINRVLLNHNYLLTTNKETQINKFSQNEQKIKTLKSQT